MPARVDKKWFVKYKPKAEGTRFILSLPVEMLDDAKVVAKLHSMSVGELVRRGLTKYMAEQYRQKPELLKLKGRVGRI